MSIKRVIFKKLVIVFLLLVIIFLITTILAFAIGEEVEAPTSYNIENPKDLEDLIRGGGSGKGSFSQSQTVNLPNGQSATVSGNIEVSNGEITYADEIKYRGANFRNIRNFKPTSDGYSASSVSQLQQGDTVITNGIGVTFSNGILRAKHADSLVRSGSVTTNIENLESKPQIFSVQKADSLVSGGITVTGIENTEFNISTNEISMKTKKYTTLHISGKSYIETDFEAFLDDSEIEVSKDKSEYEIKNGRLNYSTSDYTDGIETNSTAKIEIDESGFGFKCMLLGVKSIYWYNDKKNLRKDFGVNVPSYGDEYKLCIKRLNINYNEYDGLIDFINKNIFLSKVVNYLRYSFKDNQLLSLLSDFVYKGKDIGNKVNINLDKDFLYLNNLFIDNKNPNNNISISNSGYHEIIEVKGTRFVKISRAKFYPELIKQYKTEFENSTIEIKNKILTQNGNTKVKILSVNSPDVKKAELFLQNYWDRNKNIKLSEYLE